MTLCSARCLPMAQCSLSTGQVSTLQAMRLVLSLVGGHQPTQRVPCAIVHLKVALQPASAERKEGRGVLCVLPGISFASPHARQCNPESPAVVCLPRVGGNTY